MNRLYTYVRYIAGGTLIAAKVLNKFDQCKIAINWEGGRHHARK